MRLRSIVWLVCIGVTARGILAFISLSSEGLKRLESSEIAANLNAGQGFTFEQYGAIYYAWKEPLYIVLLAWLTRWTGTSDFSVLLFQSVFGIGTAIGIALIAHSLFRDTSRALVAGTTAAMNPFLIYYDTHFVHPLSLDSLLFVSSVGMILIALNYPEEGLKRPLAAGFVMGVALWQRWTLLAAGAAAWIIALWGFRPRRRVVAHAVVWVAAAVLTISPWIVRNYMILGRVVLTTDFAHILWLGNNPLSNGTYSDMRGQRVFHLADPVFRDRIYRTSELGQYDFGLPRFYKKVGAAGPR